MNQPARLEKMKAALQSGLDAPGDGHRQRLALNAIALHAYHTGIGPLDYIVAQVKAQLTAGATAISIMPAVPTEPAVPPDRVPAGTTAIQCRKCGRSFRSQTALNGHGEARCAGRIPSHSSPVAP